MSGVKTVTHVIKCCRNHINVQYMPCTDLVFRTIASMFVREPVLLH